MSDKKRVMWLLNHTSARKFEVPMLKESGFDEVFLPKSFPADPGFRSASVDWSEDENLTIPAEDLAELNNTNWYSGGNVKAWTIANKWFDAVFFIAYDSKLIKNIANYYKGVCIWRVFGLDKTMTYGRYLNLISQGKGAEYIRKMGKRFVFAMAYDHLANIEPTYIRDRAFYLPLGMKNINVNSSWTGEEKRILFVCPDIAINTYYNQIYKDFIKNFADFDYIISGAQAIQVPDKKVLGFVTEDEHNYNMRTSAAMFYHSQEPYHIHYHPFEAIKNGMPLLFMAGGLLDKLGGIDLPGRCKNTSEVKEKFKLIINNDQGFIKKVTESQMILLQAMSYEKLKPFWVENLPKIMQLRNDRSKITSNDYSKKKIAVILPLEYLGGSLRGAILLANAIKAGTDISGDNCKVVFYHQDSSIYNRIMFEDLDENISIRPFKWKKLDARQAEKMMAYAGYDEWYSSHNEFIIPDDGINYAFDCDLWLIVSDRVESPLLPVRPNVFMIYDYLQRRQNLMSQSVNWWFINAARRADKVIVTSEYTYQDALNYAGIDKERLRKLPMLIPDFSVEDALPENDVIDDLIDAEEKVSNEGYFVWPTNAAPHKNISEVMDALKIYYEVYNGKYHCIITGAETEKLFDLNRKHLVKAKKIYHSSSLIQKNISFKGNVSEQEYKIILKSAAFLLHSAHGDNGTFSVVEAAYYKVPSLVNYYPAINEMNENYKTNMIYYNVFEAHEFARKLKYMEVKHDEIKELLPSKQSLKKHSFNGHAKIYWDEIKGLL